jgi:uncharacterized protein YhaN
MIFRAIRICNFKKLIGPIVIDRLDPKLTVIAGDNEEGKSTVLAAIRAALFDRHRIGGEAANDMQPFGSRVRPEVSLQFELGGEAYQLRKAFCQSPEAELLTPRGRITGPAVEERLQEMFRFVLSERAKSGREHQGIWGLFWVDQGESFRPLRISNKGQEALQGALEGEVGQVLGGERGRALKAAISQRCQACVTSTGKPRGDYKDQLARVAELSAECAKLRDDQRKYEDKVDRLERVRSQLRAYERDGILARTQEALSAAEAEQRRLEGLQAALSEAVQRERLAEAELNAASERWQARSRQISAWQSAMERMAAAAETEACARQRYEEAQAEFTRAEVALAEAKKAFGRIDAIHQAAVRAVERLKLEAEHTVLQGRLHSAREAAAAAADARGKAAAIRIDQEALDHLVTLERQAGEAKVRLETAATRVDFQPVGQRRILVTGRDHGASEPIRITEPTDLSLEGFGVVRLTPGGDDLTSRRLDWEHTSQAFAQALCQAGVGSISDAQELLARRNQLLTEASVQEGMVAAHAPDGIERLAETVRLRQAQLSELAAAGDARSESLEDAEARRDLAAMERGQWEASRIGAGRSLEEVRKRLEESRDGWIAAETDLETARRTADAAGRELAVSRETAADDVLQKAVSSADEERKTAAAVSAAKRAEVASADAEAVASRLEQSKAALQNLRRCLEDLGREAAELEIELRTLGQAGSGEMLAEKEGELERARQSLWRLEQEVRALQLLEKTLSEAESEAKKTFLSPVLQRIQPYLRRLFPDSEVVFGTDDLEIAALRRGRSSEPFAALSIGTREQLAVLTRLAFADLLREKGQPAAVILDDALVYSDDQRFERMQEILWAASRKLQIIILTCRERDYARLGAPIIRLADCAAAPGEAGLLGAS